MSELNALIKLTQSDTWTDEDDLEALYACEKRKQYDCVEWLISNRHYARTSAVTHAVGYCMIPQLEIFLRYGASLNICDNEGSTELHLAIYSRRIVRLLLDAKSNLHTKNNNGETALDCAIRGSQFDTSVLLMMYGARTTNNNPPQWAIKNQFIVDRGIRARKQAIIALIYLLRVNKCPKDLTRHIAKRMFNETKCDDAWFIVNWSEKKFMFISNKNEGP